MPPKKKPSVNRTGIYYLADEYRKINPIYIRTSIHELILLLLPRWRSMSLVERKPYEDRAKQYKRDRMLNNEHVLTPVIPSSEEAIFIEKNSHENLFLDAYFSSNLIDIFQRDLFFVTFQIFCRTDDEDGGDYYPAEVAIMKYSFFGSIKQEYYTIFKPEKFPVGYTGTAIDLSRETHQIPPFDFIGANGDYVRIWQECRRVIGDSINEPIIVFCNAFERDQTTYLLNWLVTKGMNSSDNASKPIFRVYSFEALVAAILRRIGIGDFAHQSVREQLRRPVYTLQVKDRCVYHDSLAIQYCSRAINHGFSLFLDGFVRERFIQTIPEYSQMEKFLKSIKNNSSMHRTQSIDDEPATSCIDSISSTFIEKKKGLRSLTQPRQIEESKTGKSDKVKLRVVGSNVFIQPSSSPPPPPPPSSNPPSSINQQMSILSIESKLLKSRVPSLIEIDCRWPVSSLYNNNSEDDNQYITTGRGIRKTVQQASTVYSNDSNSIGRGRRINVIPPIPGFSM